MRCEVFMAASIKTMAIWQVTPCQSYSTFFCNGSTDLPYVGGPKIFWTGAAICTAVVLVPSTSRR